MASDEHVDPLSTFLRAERNRTHRARDLKIARRSLDGNKRAIPYGNVTFTFLEDYSSTGGVPPPLHVLHGERVLEPEAKVAIEYIKSFGLSESMSSR